jgi:uncharacterized protein
VHDIIYLHGFNSSPRSTKAQVIQANFQNHHHDMMCHVPALAVEPARAVDHISELIVQIQAEGKQPALMGSSLGGFYATYLSEQFNLKAVLINPAVAAHQLLVDQIGEQTNFHTDEKYQFKQEYIEQLRALDITRLTYSKNFFVLLQTGDEVLDYQRAIALFSRSSLWVSGGGSHSFDQFELTLPAVLNFLRNVN